MRADSGAGGSLQPALEKAAGLAVAALASEKQGPVLYPVPPAMEAGGWAREGQLLLTPCPFGGQQPGTLLCPCVDADGGHCRSPDAVCASLTGLLVEFGA